MDYDMLVEPMGRIPPRELDSHFFSVEFCNFDTICVVGANYPTIVTIKTVLGRSYFPGIQKDRHYDHVEIIKLRGYPFRSKSLTHPCKRLDHKNIVFSLCRLLDILARKGWELIGSANLNDSSELSTWVFMYCQNLKSTKHAMIDMHSGSTLKLYSLNQNIYNKLLIVCRQHWQPGIIHTDHAYDSDIEDVFTIRFNGTPWKPSNKHQSLEASILGMEIVKCLVNSKWRLKTTSNLSGLAETMIFESNGQTSKALSSSTDCLDSCNELVNLSVGSTYNPTYFLINFNKGNRIQMVLCPIEVQSIIKATLLCTKPDCVKKDKTKENVIVRELKLRGQPWNVTSVKSVVMVTAIINDIWNKAGWKLSNTLDLSIDGRFNTAVFLFEQCDTWFNCDISCIHFSHSTSVMGLSTNDQIFFINVSETDAHVLREKISKLWKLDQTSTQTQISSSVYQLYSWQLRGTVWSSKCPEKKIAFVRELQVRLIECMTSLRWKFYFSNDIVSGSLKMEKDAQPFINDTLWFVRRRSENECVSRMQSVSCQVSCCD